jgi:glycosyltransferase involved in cell wall biosynthesis
MALHALKDELGCQDWACQIIGPADAPEELAKMVADLNLTGWVELVGARPHKQALEMLSRMAIGVAPEPFNPFNDQSTMIKVMEYMALGLPVVAYDLTEHRITAGDTALYAQRNDPRAMARQIAALLDDPALRVRLGAAGRRRAEEVLAWPHSGKRLLACYDALAAR